MLGFGNERYKGFRPGSGMKNWFTKWLRRCEGNGESLVPSLNYGIQPMVKELLTLAGIHSMFIGLNYALCIEN